MENITNRFRIIMVIGYILVMLLIGVKVYHLLGHYERLGASYNTKINALMSDK